MIQFYSSIYALIFLCLQPTNLNSTNSIADHSVSPLPEPIGKGRSSSTSSSITSNDSGNYYQRAPGSEREDIQVSLLVPKSETQGFDSWLTSSLRIECNCSLATLDVQMMSETKFYS